MVPHRSVSLFYFFFFSLLQFLERSSCFQLWIALSPITVPTPSAPSPHEQRKTSKNESYPIVRIFYICFGTLFLLRCIHDPCRYDTVSMNECRILTSKTIARTLFQRIIFIRDIVEFENARQRRHNKSSLTSFLDVVCLVGVLVYEESGHQNAAIPEAVHGQLYNPGVLLRVLIKVDDLCEGEIALGTSRQPQSQKVCEQMGNPKSSQNECTVEMTTI